jgi:hypothetical protein
MGRGVITALGSLAGLVALTLWHPARVAVQAVLLLPALFPAAPVDLLALAPPPTRTEHSLMYPGGQIHVDLFHPAGGGRHGAMVLLLGAGDTPRSDLAVRFADALARSGVLAALPQSDGLLAERLTFDEVDGIRAELDLLAAQPDVDVSRIGILGLSAAGGLAIVAAAQPDLRGRVAFVNSFGSYFDARSLLVDVASRSIQVDGATRAWQPEQRTLEVIAASLAAPGLDELLAGTTRERALALIGAFPADSLTALDRISPSTYAGSLRTRLYVMHDVDDTFIPFTQSRAMVQATHVERYTEFAIFAHVIPDKPVPLQTFLPDIWRLFWHVHAVLLEVL